MGKRLRKNRAELNGKENVVAKLSDSDLREFNSRQALMSGKYQEFLAAGAYVDAFNREITAKYGLPNAFQVKTETGDIIVPHTEEPEEVTIDG